MQIFLCLGREKKNADFSLKAYIVSAKNKTHSHGYRSLLILEVVFYVYYVGSLFWFGLLFW